VASGKYEAGSTPRGSDQDVIERGLVHIHPAYRETREASIDLMAQSRIGLGLRGMYEDLLNQPVPDHLADLIRRLS
jgi:hypothetical protein